MYVQCSFNKSLLAESVSVDELVSLIAPLCDINDHPMVSVELLLL